MDQLIIPANVDDDFPADTQQEWVLKSLKPKHLQICALLAQGFKNIEVAKIVGVTPEYVSMLLRQPLIRQEISRVSEIAGARLELMFTKVVDTIGETLENGSASEKLKAARLHGELTHRIGRPDPYATNNNPADDRLEKLANRLEHLLDTKKGGLYDEAGNPVEDAEVIRTRTYGGRSEAAPQSSDWEEA